MAPKLNHVLGVMLVKADGVKLREFCAPESRYWPLPRSSLVLPDLMVEVVEVFWMLVTRLVPPVALPQLATSLPVKPLVRR
jgi:hypothetical protein